MSDLSLGIPLYRSAPFLPGLFDRLRRTSTPPAEIVFVDDASPDDSCELAARFAAEWAGTARVLRNDANRGIAATYNRLAMEAKSPWVQILDADDYPVGEDYFARVIRRLDDRIDMLVTSVESNARLLDAGARAVAPFIPRLPPPWLPLLGSVATRSGVIYRRSLLLDLAFPDPAYPGSDVIHLAVLRQRFRCAFEAEARVYYAVHPGASSAQARTYVRFRQALAQLPVAARAAHLVDLGLRRLGQAIVR